MKLSLGCGLWAALLAVAAGNAAENAAGSAGEREEPAAQPPIEAATDDVFEFDLSTVVELGTRIGLMQGYAAAATDILLTEVPDPGSYALRGWVITEDERGLLVTFLGEYLDGLGAMFDIRPDAPLGEQLTAANGRVLDAEERARFAARATALDGVAAPCSERYETVVLRDPASSNWLVYALAASDDPGRIMIGGHYRITVAADGFSILRSERLSRDCLEIELDADASSRPDLVLVPHKTTDLPLETHVYMSLLHQIDLAVATRGAGIWRVSGPEITQMAGIAPPR